MDFQPLINLLGAAQVDEFQVLAEKIRAPLPALDGYAEVLAAALAGGDAAQVATAAGALEDACDGYPTGVLQRLPTAASWINRKSARTFADSMQSALDRMRTAGASRDVAALAALRYELRTRSQELGSLQVRQARIHRRRTLLRRALVALLVIAPLAAAIYLRIQDGLEHISTEVIFPNVPCTAATPDTESSLEVVSAIPANRVEFMHEFSKYYFGRENQFRSKYLEANPDSAQGEETAPGTQAPAAPPSASRPPGTRAETHFTSNEQSWGGQSIEDDHLRQRTKTLVRNRSHFTSTSGSTLPLTATLEQSDPFPWNEMSVSPRLTIEDQPRIPRNIASITIRNEGIGPALDVRWQLRSDSGLTIDHGATDLFHEGILTIDLPRESDSVSPWPVAVGVYPWKGDRNRLGRYPRWDRVDALANADGIRLGKPLFRRVPDGVALPADDSDFFAHEGVNYETIHSLERLLELTNAVYREPFTLTIHYTAIDNVARDLRYRGDLPLEYCYYARHKDLLEFDPRQGELRERRAAEATFDFSRWVDLIAPAFSPPPGDPRGVDLLTLETSLDLRNLDQGMGRTTTVAVDKFLNPRGAIAFYMTLVDASPGRYRITLSASGMPVHEFHLDVSNPEYLHWPEDREARKIEVRRLQNIFRQHAAPSASQQ
jgi:hypothetical protein